MCKLSFSKQWNGSDGEHFAECRTFRVLCRKTHAKELRNNFILVNLVEHDSCFWNCKPYS